MNGDHMSFLTTREIRNINVLRIYAEREELLIHPDYQRRGDIWDNTKKQLFIDSILNVTYISVLEE